MQHKPSMIIGQKGVKYGLQSRQPQKPQQAAGRLAVFSADSDSDQDVGAQVARQAARKVADSKVQDMYAAALADDPTAFAYDEVYDNIQEQKAAAKQQDKVAKQPKYIASLLEQAEQRKREQAVTYERRLLKERQKDDHMYDSEEKFITSAYRKKLEEDKLWQESQRLKDLEDERNDVIKLGHMRNFLRLAKDVALGGTASQQQPDRAQPNNKQQQPSASSAGSPALARQQQQQQAAHDQLDAVHESKAQQQHSQEQQEASGQQQQDAADSISRQQVPPEPRFGSRLQGSHDDEQEQLQQEQQHRPLHRASQEAGFSSAAAVNATGAAQEQHQEQQATAVGGKRKNDEASVTAARERYLARKRQQSGA